MNLIFKLLEFGSLDQLETIELRDKILRKPLGLVFSPEQLASEKDQFHLAAYNNDKLIACLLLKDFDAIKMKMRQVAVDDKWQKKGVGKLLVEDSEKIAKGMGKKIMFCHAREVAVPFYTKLGYEIVGERFEEVGIPHFKMEKML